MFEEAGRLSGEVASVVAEAAGDERDGAALAKARERLVERVMDGMEERVKEAARRGLREVSVYTFEGTELIDGFFTLYLLKGPRTEGAYVAAKTRAKTTPVMHSLARRLHPFTLRHQWVEGTLHNQVIMSWGQEGVADLHTPRMPPGA